MMTIASPMAARAMTEARTATWLRLETVRNWGAPRETSAPSTTMIATRLNSRWRAIAPSHGLRDWAAPMVTVTPGSSLGARAGVRAGRVVVTHAAGGREHHPFLGRPIARDLGGDP